MIRSHRRDQKISDTRTHKQTNTHDEIHRNLIKEDEDNNKTDKYNNDRGKYIVLMVILRSLRPEFDVF